MRCWLRFPSSLLALAGLLLAASCATPPTTAKDDVVLLPLAKRGLVVGDPQQYARYDFSAIDHYVAGLSAKDTASPKLLVASLLKGAKTPVEEVRALFVWVADNVAYDGRSFSVGDFQRLDLEQVFLGRKGVCIDYAVLLNYLAQLAGYNSQVVVGNATGYPSSILLGDTLHAWNAIKIEGAWYLFDVTWSSGGLDQNYVFHKSTTHNAYFLSVPSEFARSHFPMDPLWQLLSPPVTFNRFLQIAKESSRS